MQTLGPFRNAVTVLACVICAPVLSASRGFELPPTFHTETLQASSLGDGANYRIAPQVQNDGRFNHYRLTSERQSLDAVSDELAMERTQELDALVSISKIKKSEAFAKGFEKAAAAPIAITEQVLTDPVGTVAELPQGIAKLFTEISDAIGDLGGGKSDGPGEDEMLKDLIGYNKAKRGLALDLNVDPYTSNELLQRELGEVAWAVFAGGAPIDAAMFAAPAGAGLAIGAAERATVERSVWQTSPKSLRARIVEQGRARGMADDAMEQMFANGLCTPRHQSVAASAIYDLPAGLGAELIFAQMAAAGDEMACRIAQRTAELIHAYHHTRAPVKLIQISGDMLYLQDESNRIVVPLYADYLPWTAQLESDLMRIPQSGPRHLWLSGRLSKTAREAVSDMGFAVQERVLDEITRPIDIAGVLLGEDAANGAPKENQTRKLVKGVGDGVNNLFKGIGNTLGGITGQNGSAAQEQTATQDN